MSRLDEIEARLNRYDEILNEGYGPVIAGEIRDATLPYGELRALLAVARAAEAYLAYSDHVENSTDPIDWDIADKNVENIRAALDALDAKEAT